MTKKLLSGNEALAQGAWEAGATFGFGYPGTPSTEAMESFSTKEAVYAEWCPNEKVALEAAMGASAAGARVLVTMKHVGVNVAADPLFTAAYTGVGGGVVIMTADDPGMHSSQNEQDSRFYAQAAKVPMFEPADSEEALQFTHDAFDLSERFDVPFFLRTTVRISHTKTLVNTGGRKEVALKEYITDPAKWVMMPAFAKPRRLEQDKRVKALETWVEDCPYNTVHFSDKTLGIICAGATYQHVVEALPDASIFKLGISWPLPEASLKRFAAEVDEVFVVEEASDYLSSNIAALGIMLAQPQSPLSPAGELTPGAIREAFGRAYAPHCKAFKDLPARPPALCPGCPHRLVFKELTRLKAIVTGDIGCYTLGALPPLSAVDTCLDMGASISMAHGFELALAETEHRPIVAVIGDSTFAHSGLSSLMNTVYNKGSGTVIILDNRTTAMTGRQGNPFNGQTLQERPSQELNLEALVRSLGVQDVQTLDPNQAKEVRYALKQATSSQDLSVLIFRSPCVLIERKRNAPVAVTSACKACGVCSSLGCPAIALDSKTGIACIDKALCVGCGHCEQYCSFGAIQSASQEAEV